MFAPGFSTAGRARGEDGVNASLLPRSEDDLSSHRDEDSC